jgi:ABC-type Fe3+ transport system permease subunit
MKTSLMNTTGTTTQGVSARRRITKYVTTVLILLTLLFSLGPIGSAPLGGAATVEAAQTRRYRHRRHRTFWQKHRDKLTLAGTTAGGAAVGGIAGGKKGAAIGSLVGLGGGALYTYKIRKRHKHRRY